MAPQVEINAGEEGSSESVWAAVALFFVTAVVAGALRLAPRRCAATAQLL